MSAYAAAMTYMVQTTWHLMTLARRLALCPPRVSVQVTARIVSGARSATLAGAKNPIWSRKLHILQSRSVKTHSHTREMHCIGRNCDNTAQNAELGGRVPVDS